MPSSSDNSDSDSGTNFKRGRRESSHKNSTSKKTHERRDRSPHRGKHEKSHREKGMQEMSPKAYDEGYKNDRKRHSRSEYSIKSDSKTKTMNDSEQRRSSSGETKNFQNSEVAYGPSLPPMQQNSPPKVQQKPALGPTLPEGFVPNYSCTIEENSSDDEETFGPLPSSSAKITERDLEMEKRKIEIKLRKLENKDEASKNVDRREEWMLELPEIKKVTDLGLGARQFRKNDRPDFSDRSSWTNTPNEVKSVEKQDQRTEDDDRRRAAEVKRRDEEQDRMSKAHKKKHKRDKSLLDIHKKKLKKEKKKQKGDKKSERRPFDRDTDLSANKFDDARKKSAIKKAQLLDTRFGSGSQRFL